jgi:predicted DNA-binding transcriptional regulator AlpA
MPSAQSRSVVPAPARENAARDAQQSSRDPFHPEVLVIYLGLQALGIPYTRVHLRRLMKEGKFPLPVQISENRIAWRLGDLREWQANLPILTNGCIDRSKTTHANPMKRVGKPSRPASRITRRAA